jgi:hypothetical protein
LVCPRQKAKDRREGTVLITPHPEHYRRENALILGSVLKPP